MNGCAGRQEKEAGSARDSASSEMTREHARGEAARGARREEEGRRGLLAALPGLVLAAAAVIPRRAAALDPDGDFQQVGSLVIYLAVIPAAIVRGHPPEHTGRGLHGGVPAGRYVHHLLLALFDAATGARITDAEVTAVVHGLSHPEDRIELGPMTVAGASAYGGLATLPARDYYRIEVEVRRPGAPAPTRAVFHHRHFQP